MSFRRFLQRSRIVEQNPFDYRNWQAAILDEVIMKLPQSETFALPVFVAAEQIHDLPFADYVADFLCRTRRCPGSFAFRCFAIQSAGVHEIFDRLLKTPSAGVQVYIYAD